MVLGLANTLAHRQRPGQGGSAAAPAPTPAKFVCPGVAGNYLSVPDSAPLDITTKLEIVVRVALDNWQAAQIEGFVTKANDVVAGGTERSYFLRASASASRRLQFLASTDGATLPVDRLSDILPAFAGGQMVWTRARYDGNDGAGNNVTTFHYSSSPSEAEPLPSEWTAAGISTFAGVSPIFVGAAPLFIGSDHISRFLAGRPARVIVRSNGVTVLDVSEGSADPALTTFVCATGQTVTETGNVIVPGP